MPRVLIGFLFALATAFARGAESFPTEAAAIDSIVGGDVKAYAYKSSTFGAGPLSNVFGIVYSRDSTSPYAKLFALSRRNQSGYSISAVSKKFDHFQEPYARYYVEIIEATGSDSFFVQFNDQSSYCGVATHVFRFKRIKNTWRVAGEDIRSPDTVECDPNVESEYSANFLTGDVVVTTLTEGKRTKVARSKRVFPSYLMSDFDPHKTK